MKKRIEEIHLTLLEAHKAFPKNWSPGARKCIYRAMLEAEDILTPGLSPCGRERYDIRHLRYFILKAFREMEGKAYPREAKIKMSRAIRLVNFKPVKDFDDENAESFLEEFSDEG